MYFPSDPKKITALWDKFAEGLVASGASIILENGHPRPTDTVKAVTSIEAGNVLNRLKKLDYVRLGGSRLLAVPPHFGVVLNSDGLNAMLVEYLALENTSERIARDISLLVDLIFYELPNLQKLSVPLDVAAVVVPGIMASVGSESHGTLFIRSSMGEIGRSYPF